jgi:hypothetical protein
LIVDEGKKMVKMTGKVEGNDIEERTKQSGGKDERNC